MCDCCSSEKDIYLPELATITKAEMMNQSEMFMHLEFDSGKKLGHEAGQFVEVSIAGIGEAPISVSSSPEQKGFEMVIRNVGRLTNAIHALKAGDKLGIRGPYGSGYPVDELKGKDLVFICGGIGLVPQRSLINYVISNKDNYGKIVILQGTKEYEQRIYNDDLKKWDAIEGVTVLETIDVAHDSWNGNVGVVTTLIPKIEVDLTTAMNLICGPPIMYKFVLMTLQEKEVSHDNIFVNLERRMKCGVGKCGHCQMNDQYVCQTGPVYRYSELANVPEAI